MDDDETMTEAQIDAEFERTQPIGNAINALAQAELAVAAVDGACHSARRPVLP